MRELLRSVAWGPRRDLAAWAFIAAPWLLLCLLGILLTLPATDGGAIRLLSEDGAIENVTFAVAAVAAILAFLRVRPVDHGLARLVWALFGLLMAFVALEEIAWGERILGVQLIPGLAELNAQGETTFHNLGPFQGHSEWMRLGYVASAWVGVYAGRLPSLREAAVPLRLVWWLAAILAHVIVDSAEDFVDLPEALASVIQRLSEATELLIVLSAVVFALVGGRSTSVAPDG